MKKTHLLLALLLVPFITASSCGEETSTQPTMASDDDDSTPIPWEPGPIVGTGGSGGISVGPGGITNTGGEGGDGGEAGEGGCGGGEPPLEDCTDAPSRVQCYHCCGEKFLLCLENCEEFCPDCDELCWYETKSCIADCNQSY